MTDDAAPQIDFLSFHLDVLSDLLKEDITGAYQDLCGVSLRDLRVLRFVGLQPGVTPGRLAQLCHYEKPLVSKLITPLVQRGYLRRQVDAASARYVNLTLTDAGRQAVAACDQLGKENQDQLMQALSESEQVVLMQCIAKLTTRLKTTRVAPGARPGATSRPPRTGALEP